MSENNRIMWCKTIETNITTSKSKAGIPVLARVVMAAVVAGAGALGTAHADGGMLGISGGVQAGDTIDVTQAVPPASSHVGFADPMANSRKTTGSCGMPPDSLKQDGRPAGLCGIFSGPIENTWRGEAYVVLMGSPIVNERRGGSY